MGGGADGWQEWFIGPIREFIGPFWEFIGPFCQFIGPSGVCHTRYAASPTKGWLGA